MNMSDVCPFCLFPPQSFNAPPRSKMKLWKGATFAFMLCGAALSLLLTRNMATIGQFKPTRVKYPQASSISSRPSSSSPPPSSSLSSSSPPPSSILPSTMTPKPSSSYSSQSSSSYRRTGGLQRRARSTEGMNSIFSECKINCFGLPL